MEEPSSKPNPKPQDESLLEHLRALSPEERLALNDASIQVILELRASFGARSPAPESAHD